MTKEQFDELKIKVEQDMNITEDNLQEKLLKLPNLYCFYSKLYSNERRLLTFKISERDRLFKQKYHFYKFENEFALGSAKEIEYYVNGDDDYYKISLAVQGQEIIVKFLEQTMDNIKNTGYTIKNYIDYTKIKEGLS